MKIKRNDGRKSDEIRNLVIARNYLKDARGSVLITAGDTKVICSVSVINNLPLFLRQSGAKHGWLTAEYDMLPASCNNRLLRDRYTGKIKGRSQEIQRLIGRSLRAVTDLTAIPEKTIYVDCDVIQADGGTRTTAINGSFIALYDAFSSMKAEKKIETFPLNQFLGAISVGIVEGEILLDLDYDEDVNADVDMNIVKDDKGNYIELQGTSEKESFSDENLQTMLKYADKGIKEIVSFQKNLIMKKIKNHE